MKKKALVLCVVISLLMSSVSVNATEITETVNTEIVTEATEMSVETTTEDVTAEEVTEAASEETMVSEAIPEVTTENEEVLQGVSSSDIKVSGVAHVQGLGDVKGVWDSQTNTLKLGTTGQSKRLEAITLNLENNTGYEGSIKYRVHRQTYGWTNYIKEGKQAGTTGEAKRLEGIQIYLTGELAKHYSVRYRVHIQTYGWSQGWQYDCAMAGTEGEAKRLEALEIQIVPRTEEVGVIYRVHRQTTGWEKTYSKNGEVAGTTGQGKRLEAIEIAITGNDLNKLYEDRGSNIYYRTYIQSYGWKYDVSGDGGCAGTIGQGKRMEAIQIRLAGEVARYYDIYYRVHAQSYGWLGWAKTGEFAGTAGYGKRLEAIQIVIKRKGEAAPGEVYKGVKQDCKYNFIANSATKNVEELAEKYGYSLGDGDNNIDISCPSGRWFNVCGGSDIGIFYYDYVNGEENTSIRHTNNNFHIYDTTIDGVQYYSYGDNIYAGDSGYEFVDSKYYTVSGSECIAVSDETNNMINEYIKNAITDINEALKDNGLDTLKR